MQRLGRSGWDCRRRLGPRAIIAVARRVALLPLPSPFATPSAAASPCRFLGTAPRATAGIAVVWEANLRFEALEILPLERSVCRGIRGRYGRSSVKRHGTRLGGHRTWPAAAAVPPCA